MTQNKSIDNGEWKEILSTELDKSESLEQFYSLVKKKVENMVDGNQDNILLCIFPQEILLIIFTFVGLSNWNSLVLVCRGFRDLLYPQPLWNSFFNTNFIVSINGQQYTIHFPPVSRNVISATFSLVLSQKLFYDLESWIKDRSNLKSLKIEYKDLASDQYNDRAPKTNIEYIFNCPKITSLTIQLPISISAQVHLAIIFKIIEENVTLRNLNFTFNIANVPNIQLLEIQNAIISFLTNSCQRYDYISINIVLWPNQILLWNHVFKQILPFLKYTRPQNSSEYFVTLNIEFLKK